MLVVKNVTEKFQEKAGNHVRFDGIDQFYTYLCLHATFFLSRKTAQSCMAGENLRL